MSCRHLISMFPPSPAGKYACGARGSRDAHYLNAEGVDRWYTLPMETEVCRLCGGDGRIGNALGRSSATCPSCHGSGRRADTSSGFRDVTKTKPSHYRTASSAPAAAAGPKGPVTSEGVQLASEVNASTVLATDAKARLL